MRKKIIGILFFSMLMMGVISYANAGPSETAALDRDRDRISDNDRDRIQDRTSDDCEDELRIRERYRNRTGLGQQNRIMKMNCIEECDPPNVQIMLQIRERIRNMYCEDVVID